MVKQLQKIKVAVVLPCFNEGLTIAFVVSEFKQALPDAEIFVFDNGSNDDTVLEATIAGAQFTPSIVVGKGMWLRRFFEMWMLTITLWQMVMVPILQTGHRKCLPWP